MFMPLFTVSKMAHYYRRHTTPLDHSPPTIDWLRLLKALALLLFMAIPDWAQAQPPTGQSTVDSSQLASLLQADHFRLTATIRIVDEGFKGFSYEATIVEMYSNELQRARLQIHGPEGSAKTLFYATKGGKFLTVAPDPYKPNMEECELSSEMALAGHLFGDKVESRTPYLKSWLKLIPTETAKNEAKLDVDHLIGAARLLLLVELNRDSLKQSELSKSFKYSVLGVDVDQYELGLPFPTGQGQKQLELKVFFARKLHANVGGDSTLLVPRRIALTMPDGAQMLVDYSIVSSIHAVDLLGDTSSKVLDLFSYPIGFGCSSQLKGDQAAYNRGRRDDTTERRLLDLEGRQIVSFTAQMNLYHGAHLKTTRDLFVAYDGFARAMRQDTLHRWANSYSIQLHDIWFKQKYYLQGNVYESAGRLSQRAILSELTMTRPNCYATQAEFGGPNPLLPFRELVEMGTTYVRGMRARVYEHETEELPELIFQKVAYVDSQGRKMARFDTSISTDQDGSYSIVYYFFEPQMSGAKAESMSGLFPGDQLVRLDIYRAGVLKYQIDVLNFRWQLSNAPNGDRQDQLFAVQDRCGATSGQTAFDDTDDDKAVSVTKRPASLLLLELAYVEAPQRLAMTADQVIEMIKYAPVRHKALIRGIVSNSNSIYATQILNIKSRVIKKRPSTQAGKEFPQKIREKKSIRIMASVELAHSDGPPRPEFEIVSVGWGQFKSFRMDQDWGQQDTVDSLTFAGCFLEAARRFSNIDWSSRPTVNGVDNVVLFSFCISLCMIDTKATLKLKEAPKQQQQHYESSVFEFETGSGAAENPDLCEIMQVRMKRSGGSGDEKPLPTPRLNEPKIEPWAEVHSRLQGKLITMRLNDVETARHKMKSDQADELDFVIESLELNSLSGEMLQDSLSTSDESSLLTGLGLIPNEPLGFKSIDLGDTYYSQDEPNPDGTQLEPPQTISADACRAFCLANFECKSYSTCLLDSDGVECVTSPMDLHNRNLMKTLKDSVRLYRKSQPSRAGSIKIDSSLLLGDGDAAGMSDGTKSKGETAGLDGDGSSDKQEQQMVEFRVDSRCELRSKRAIDLFIHLPGRIATTINLWGLKPSASPEHCAELCLRNTNRFFSKVRASQVELESGRLKPSELHDELMYIMGKFCAVIRFLDLKAMSIDFHQLGVIRKMDEFKDAPGLCYNSKPKWAVERVHNNATTAPPTSKPTPQSSPKLPYGLDSKWIRLEMDVYDFVYLNLYKRQAGSRLLGSEVRRVDSSTLKTTLMPATGSSRLQAANVEKPRVVINQQSIEQHWDVDLCARICFSQVVQWCRSFDFIQIKGLTDKKGSKVHLKPYCVYNSLTMAEAKKLEERDVERGSLIANNYVNVTDRQSQQQYLAIDLIYWHYEPQEAYAIDNVVFQALNETTPYDSISYSASPPVGSQSSSSPTVAVFIICLTGFMSGLLVSLVVTKHYNYNKQLEAHLERAMSSLGRPSSTGMNRLVDDDDMGIPI